MERIKEFLLDSNATNLSVIITSILTTAITTLLAVILKNIYDILKKYCKKFYEWIKFKIILARRRGFSLNILKTIKINRKRFNDIVSKYDKDKNIYNFRIDEEFKKIKYLSKSQKKIRDKIINENKEKIENEIKDLNKRMVDAMKNAVNLSMQEINDRFI